ncbi:MAG: hypothetical protein ABIF09_02280 [Gemmatimonadota bacterium]
MRLGSWIKELHRRFVWQVLGSYAVVAWIILQLAETLEGLIGLPLWFGPTTVVVVLLGFPVFLVTALTQGGSKKEASYRSQFRDSAEGGDESLSSWRSLEAHPMRDGLRHVFTWRNAVAGGAVMAILLVIGTAGYSWLRSAGIGPLGSLVAKGVFESNENLILSDFKEAIALDSTFSMAYRKLGVILSNDERNEDEARVAFTKADEGRKRLTDRERLLAEATYHTYVSEDLDSAIRAIEKGRAPAVSYTNAVFTLFEIGQVDSATAILNAFRDEHPNHPQAAQYAAALASARFDYEAAEGLVQQLMEAQDGNPRWEMWGEAELANYAMVRGKLNEGAERILRAHGLQDGAGTRFSEQPRLIFEATGMATLQLHFLQDSAGAVGTLDRALATPGMDSVPPAARGHLEFAGLYAQAGRADKARERLAAYRAEIPAEIRGEQGRQSDLRFVEAAVALADGRPEEAVRLYREARALAPTCEFCGLPEVGEAFEAAAMPDSAVVSYEGYLEIKALFRSLNDNVRLHRVLLGLGRSYEALGQRERAADHFRWLLGLWSEADPGLQPRVEELREKLDSLGVGGS